MKNSCPYPTYLLASLVVIQVFLFSPFVSAAPPDLLTLTDSTPSTRIFSPNADGRLDRVEIRSSLNIKGTGQTTAAVLKTELTITNSSGNRVANSVVAEPLDIAIGQINEIAASVLWDGRDESGAIVIDGAYSYSLDFTLLKGCKGKGDNRDDLHSGQIDLLNDCNSGAGNDDKGERIIASAGSLTGRVTVDKTPPLFIITSPLNGIDTNNPTLPVKAEFSDDLAGINLSTAVVALNGTDVTGSAAVTATDITLMPDMPLADGLHSVTVAVADHAGNFVSRTSVFTVDTTPPDISILSPLVDEQIDNPNPHISIAYSDTLSGINLSRVVLSLDGIDVADTATITAGGMSYVPTESLAEGEHVVTGSVSDAAGNVSEVTSSFFIQSKCSEVVPSPSGDVIPPLVFPEAGFDAHSYSDGNFKNIKVADINRDGYLDVVGSGYFNPPIGMTESSISILLGKEGGRLEFSHHLGEKDDVMISHLELSDFNNDCYPDIAVTRRSVPNNLTIYLNNGDGTFTEKSEYDVENRIISVYSSIGTGRFNGDTHEDIIVYTTDGNFTIFNGKGDGTFASPVELDVNSVYSHVVDLETLDLNEDGITDILAVMSDYNEAHRIGQEVVLLTGTESGDFDQSTVYTAGDNTISQIVVGDYNGDEHQDIVAIWTMPFFDVSSSLVLEIFLGDGSGGLSYEREQSLWIEYSGNYFAANFSKPPLALDIDGDNYDELIVGMSNKLFVYAAGENGDFEHSGTYNINSNSGINSGDFDRDGDEDIVSSGDYVHVLVNKGDGTFIDRKKISVQKGTSSIISADFDGDRRPDIAVAGSGRSEIFSTILNKGTWGEDSFVALNPTTYDAGGRPVAVKTGALNNDDRPDVVTVNKTMGTVAVFINESDGRLSAAEYYPVGQNPAELALEDIDGDGHLDIITTNEGSGDVSVLLGRGDGTFQGHKTYAAGTMPHGLAVGDFNQDGHLDIAVTNYDWNSNEISVLAGDGNGAFDSRTTHNIDAMRPEAVRKGDFNADGLLDLIVSNSHSFGGTFVALLLNKGGGTFIVKTMPFSLGSYHQAGDFNRDGILDLVDSSKIMLGDGNGGFYKKQTFGDNMFGAFAVGDMNDDGEMDVILEEMNHLADDDFLSVWTGAGTGSFKKSMSVGGQSLEALELADINGDGILDIVAINDSQQLIIICGTGDAVFEGQSVIDESEHFFSGINLASGDFNNDGNQDIAVSMYPSNSQHDAEGLNQVVVYLGTGHNTFMRGTVIETGYGTLGLHASAKIFADDYNGDGITDIALQPTGNFDDSEVAIFINDGDGTFQEALKHKIPHNRAYIKFHDITDDGYVDIITNNEEYLSGNNSLHSISIYAGNGDGTFQHYDTITLGERNSSWDTISQLEDYNNDGQQDVVVHFGQVAGQNNELKVFLNEDGSFTSDPVYEMTIDYAAQPVAGDFDNDENIDLLSTRQGGAISLFRGNGDGTFNAPEYYASGTSGSRRLVHDFNLDGRLDIVLASSASYLSLLFNDLPPLRTPPRAPATLKTQSEDSRVTLSWKENTESDIDGYNVYRSPSAGGRYEKINGALLINPGYIDYSVTNGVPYYYRVSAADVDGDESSFSVKARAVPRSPDTVPPVVTVITPFHNQTVTNPALFVTGTIDETDARVTVNGVTATVQKASGTFTAHSVSLIVGVNVIQVVAEDPSGNTSSRSLSVNYTPAAIIEGSLRDDNMAVNLKNIRVDIQDAVKTQSVDTDENGYFIVMNVFPGEVTITIRSDYHPVVVIDQEIAPGENVNLDVALPPFPADIEAWLYDSTTYDDLSHATLTITDSEKTQTVVTEDGHFVLGDIYPFYVTISVECEGYEPVTVSRYVTNRWTNFFEFYLDSLPPAIPSEVSASSDAGFVNLSWQTNSESNIAHYAIYRSLTPEIGYQLESTVANGEISYADSNVEVGATYYYKVVAVNTSGQQSAFSAEASAAPGVFTGPTGLTATPGKKQVTLSWDAGTNRTIKFYRIYRSTESGSGFVAIAGVDNSGTSFTFSNLEAGVTYYFVVVAVNNQMQESEWPDEVSAIPEAVPVDISITSPYNGAYKPTPSVIISGTVESSGPEVGVAIVVEKNSEGGESLSANYLAEVNNGRFVAETRMFPAGWNTVKAIATLPDGEQAIATIDVYIGTSTDAVELRVLPPSGIISNQTGTYDVSFEAEVHVEGTIASYSWDFEGDGYVDQVTTEAETRFGYANPGLYYPNVQVLVLPEVVDGEGESEMEITFVDVAVVNVMSRDAMDAILKGKWEGMKSALAVGDVEGAVGCLSEGSKERYRNGFVKLGEEMSRIVAGMRNIEMVEVKDGVAIYKITRDQIFNGEPATIAYSIYFEMDYDTGIWRINRF